MTREPVDQRAEDIKTLIVLGVVVVAILIGMGIAGNGTVKAVGIWLGGLGLVMLVVAAIVGTTSASWTAGRRVANVGRDGAPTRDAATPERPPVTTGTELSTDVLDKLERLARLRDNGALSPEEFAEQKAHLLGRRRAESGVQSPGTA